MSDMQDLTMTVYPPDRKPELWQVRATVFGIWAVHEAHPEEISNKRWTITHIPSGVLAFAAKHRHVAIEGAKRLHQMESPIVSIVSADGERPIIKPLPIEWIIQAAKQLEGMRLWASAGPLDVLVDDLPEYIMEQRATN